MTVADLAIIAGLVFAWGMLSAQLERFDMTALIVFTATGVLRAHGPLAPLGVAPSREAVKVLAETTLVLVLFSDASRVGLHQLRADLGLLPAAKGPIATAVMSAVVDSGPIDNDRDEPSAA